MRMPEPSTRRVMTSLTASEYDQLSAIRQCVMARPALRIASSVSEIMRLALRQLHAEFVQSGLLAEQPDPLLAAQEIGNGGQGQV